MSERFELIIGPESLNGTTYFEFVKDSKRKEICWNTDALYLDYWVFTYFVRIFEKSLDGFDPYSFCRFDIPDLERLYLRLDEFSKIIDKAENGIAPKSDYHIQERLRHELPEVGDKLKPIVDGLQALVTECLEDEEALWVLGM